MWQKHFTLQAALSGNALPVIALFLVSLCLVALIYWPGLSGTYLLDDVQNIKHLDTLPDSLTFDSLLHFIGSGISSTLGRPVSMLSFALQHDSWPNKVWDFKFVNLMLHLLNGCLLFWFLLRLTQFNAATKELAYPLAFVVSFLWLIHPIQASTVFYVIQRMTELTATFTLMGLIGYLHGRKAYLEGAHRKGYVWMSAGIGIGGILAVLSKENGILLPLYVLVIEYTLLRTVPRPVKWVLWSRLFLWLPLLMLTIYLLMKYEYMALIAITLRDFTLGERLLTETRVLIDYIGKLLLPRPQGFGIFQDDFSVSRSLMNPIGTLFSTVTLISLFIIALFYRSRQPVLSFSILWFFAGHILESSYIPLELYFEHRNYLPGAGILFAAVYYAFSLIHHLHNKPIKIIISTTFVFLLITISLVTWQEAKLWGQPLKQAFSWANEKPLSRRAHAQLGSYLLAIGEQERGIESFSYIADTFPKDVVPYLVILQTGCNDKSIPPPPHEIVIERMKIAVASASTTIILNQIIDTHGLKKCPQVTSDHLMQIIDTLIGNNNYARQKDNLFSLKGQLYINAGDYQQARINLDIATTYKAHVGRFILLAKISDHLGESHAARNYLEKAKLTAEKNILTRTLNLEKISRLEIELQNKNSLH